jgi:hypothetical protein
MSDDRDHWRQMAVETHAKLIDTREQLARANAANHERVAGIRLELLRACEAASDYVAEIQRGHTPQRAYSQQVAAKLDSAISRAGGGG